MESLVRVTTRELVGLKRYASLLQTPRVRIKARGGGQYLSEQKGRGMEYAESRPYETGDDIRNLDWRVMARSGKAHTKLFREERERPVFFLIDLRRTMFFATRGMFKSVLAARIAAILAWNALSHSDRVGGIIFNEHNHKELKPRRGKAGVLHFINSLVRYSESPAQDMGEYSSDVFAQALIRLRRLVKPGSLIYIISDFRQWDEASEQQLMQMSRHNELSLYALYDILEQELPESGRYTFCEGEQFFQLPTSDKRFLQRYQEQHQQQMQAIESLCSRGQIALRTVRTDADPVNVLSQQYR